jgi:SAM-dependent methyltransferase
VLPLSQGADMDTTKEIDVEKIMEWIRENIRKRQLESSASEATLSARNGQLEADLAALHSRYDIYHIHFTSHRRLFGWLVVSAKKVLRKLLTPILEQQLMYNAANARMASLSWERLGQVSQQHAAMLQALRAELEARLGETGQRQTAVEGQLREMEQRQAAALQAARADIGAQLTQMGQRQAALEGQLREAGERQVVTLQALQEAVERHVRNLGHQQESALQALREVVIGQVEGLGDQQESALQALREALVGQVERLGYQLQERVAQLKTNLIQQERRLTLFLEEARKRLPEPLSQEQLQILNAEGKHILDTLYVSIEDEFRGTRQEIKERFREHLAIIKEAKLGTAEMPILDLGCGRGEWLELLQEEGFQARGVDINRVLVELCRERQLDVMNGDVMAYLRSLPHACLGAVTGFHLIEHLPFDVLIELLDETVRVLKPGGLAIFETPNPRNVLVGSCTFYMDPTHRNPLPSELMRLLAEARGLCHVEVIHLHPATATPVQENTEVAKRFNDYFYGAMDYAIVGRRV